MEEDVEIDLLYKTHGQILMEAAAAENIEDEEEKRGCGKDFGGEKVTRIDMVPDNEIAGKKLLPRRKLKRRKKVVGRIKNAPIKKKVVYEDSSTDMEELLDAQIMSCLVDGGVKSTPESNDEIYTGFERKNESENCINEILDDEFVFGEKCADDVQTQVGKNNNSKSCVDSCILELKSLQNVIDKREDILIKLERKLKDELIENKSEQRQVQEEINTLLHNETSKFKNLNLSTRLFLKKFGAPYFHDSSHFPAPPNNDVKKKEKQDELIITQLPKLKYWRKCNKDKLQDSVQLTLLKENSEKLVNEINKLTAQLKNVPDEQTEVKIKGNIMECQKELKKLNSKSYLDLIANEDPDREYDWLKYSASDLNGVFGPDECRRFWHLYLKPSINKSRWDRNEDDRLKELAEEMNFQDWDKIARALQTDRTAYQCLIHYRNRLYDKQDHSVGKWTKEEDEKLLNVINSAKIGEFIPWTKVASYMGDRTHSQIYNRYVNCLDPKLVKGRFSTEEDLLIVSGIEVFGATYKEMASLMSNRTPSQIRERYERHLLPKTVKTGSFSLEEDEQLLKLVDKHGERNFALVADEMKTRSRTQIRQRYNFMMKEMKTKLGWTPAQARRRGNNKISKDLTRNQRKIEKLRREVEDVEKIFKLSTLESDTFRIEKLKELRDKIFMKQYDLTKFKKKTVSENSEVNNQLLEFFRYHHVNNPFKSPNRRTSVNHVAYLNEMLLLAKYFGYDLQLPECEIEILENNRLSNTLKTFLVEALKQQADKAVCNIQDIPEASSALSGEPNNIDYIEPEEDDTLIMEEHWHNPTVNLSSLNFSEFFKRTVFDYSSGMHRDIWFSKVIRSKVAVFSNNIIIAEPPIDQQYFFPPNRVTTLGYKSVLLSRNRLRRDANKLLREQIEVKSENTPSYTLHIGKFQETLLSLFYCPKVLSVTDINATLLPLTNKNRPTSKSQSLTNHENIVHLVYNVNENTSDIVRKEAQPIKDDALKAKKIKKDIQEYNQTRQNQLQEFKVGITYKRKMKIEHLVKNVRSAGRTSSKTQVNERRNLMRKERKDDTKFQARKFGNGSNSLRTNDAQNTNDCFNNKVDNVNFCSAPVFKVPAQTYSRSHQSLKRHLDSDKHTEPANKKSNHPNSENIKSTQFTSREDDSLCHSSQSEVSTNNK